MLIELNKLKEKHYIIGDVRGYGYFIGIDFVKNRETREPAIENARVILERYFLQKEILLYKRNENLIFCFLE